MTNSEISSINAIRTDLWIRSLFQVSRLRRPEDIAEHIQTKLVLDQYDATAMKRYAKGTQFPVKGGHPYACGEWVKHAAKVWPSTGAWFCTPFWYLLENAKPTPDDLVTCANGLPARFREDLLEDAAGCSALRLKPISKDYIYVFVDVMNPWSLGALAFAMRRAELAAEVGTMRWACVGILWSVNYLLESTDSLMHPPLEKLRDVLASHFDGMIYPMRGQLSAPISKAEIARFDREREAFVKYFEECEFSEWEFGTSPPWIRPGSSTL